MTQTIARPEDVQLDRQQMAAMGYLASYRGHTRDLYGINLRQWFEWCEARGMKPLEATRAHIEVYARELEERRGLKLSTVANKLNTLSGFYRFAVMDRYIDNDPAEFVRRPKVPRQSTTKALTRREILAVWDLAKESGHSCDLLVIGFLGLLGLRVGEACALNIEDLAQQGSYLTVQVGREKGNRAGRVPIPMPMLEPIQRLMRYEKVGPVLRMRGGERMDRRGAARVVKRLCTAAGVTKRITPHSLRHTFITLSHDAGVNPRLIQHSMGYADLRMVSYYDHFEDNPAKHATHSVCTYIEMT